MTHEGKVERRYRPDGAGPVYVQVRKHGGVFERRMGDTGTVDDSWSGWEVIPGQSVEEEG